MVRPVLRLVSVFPAHLFHRQQRRGSVLLSLCSCEVRFFPVSFAESFNTRCAGDGVFSSLLGDYVIEIEMCLCKHIIIRGRIIIASLGWCVNAP